jgi:hypothetical protein
VKKQAGVAGLLLIMLTACPASGVKSPPAIPSPSESASAPAASTPTVSPTSEDLTNMPTCEGRRIRITAASFEGGLTAGGDAVLIHLATDADCWLTHRPAIMFYDAKRRLISVGVVDLRQTKVLLKSGSTSVAGEWRNVCTPVSLPLEVRMLIENRLVVARAKGSGMPTCFVNSAPSEPSEPPPSGSLSLSLESA